MRKKEGKSRYESNWDITNGFMRQCIMCSTQKKKEKIFDGIRIDRRAVKVFFIFLLRLKSIEAIRRNCKGRDVKKCSPWKRLNSKQTNLTSLCQCSNNKREKKLFILWISTKILSSFESLRSNRSVAVKIVSFPN